MKHSTDRILVSHTGLLNLLQTRPGGRQERTDAEIQDDVDQAVRLQVEAGITVINDGQQGGVGSLDLTYGAGLQGIERRPVPAGEAVGPGTQTREGDELAEFFEMRMANLPAFMKAGRPTCVGPLALKDPAAIHREIAFLKTSLQTHRGWEEAFFAIVSPSWLHQVSVNQYYRSDEEYMYALAAVMKPVYKAIADAGFLLHIDAPDIAYDWERESYRNPKLTLEEYRKLKRMHIEANNAALEGIPEDRIRVHVCWGSWSSPHMYCIPLREIADLLLMVKAQCISIEAAKPNHTHEWEAWRDIRIPDGKILMPGVIDHTTDVREHPEVIAERIIRYASIVGRENVIAGTDCGMRGHPQRDWIKYRAMVEGAELASRRLWKRA